MLHEICVPVETFNVLAAVSSDLQLVLHGICVPVEKVATCNGLLPDNCLPLKASQALQLPAATFKVRCTEFVCQ